MYAASAAVFNLIKICLLFLPMQTRSSHEFEAQVI